LYQQNPIIVEASAAVLATILGVGITVSSWPTSTSEEIYSPEEISQKRTSVYGMLQALAC
jgi:hypothetical protein